MPRPEHDFTCECCLTCIACGRSMAALASEYEPCMPTGHRHRCGSEFGYAPEWAIPLDRLTER